MVETLCVFPIGLLIFTMLFWGLASGWSIFWIDFQLQEAVICLSDSSLYECQVKHSQKIRQGAHYLRISSLNLEKSGDHLYGKVQFSFPFSGQQNFKLEKTIPWPIRR